MTVQAAGPAPPDASHRPLAAPWASVERTEIAGTPLGMYIHVPFCERRCGYCAFNTYALGAVGGAAALERFVEGAVAEISLADGGLGGTRPPLTSVFFGGGTPTMLEPAQVGRLLSEVTARFETCADLEVTIEANPDGLRGGQLEGLRSVGVTRVSFGMQSVRRRVLDLLDRTHDPEQALRAVDEARGVGFDHISLDLIYGTPGETPEDWTATVDAAISSGVDHVSAYALGIEPGTKLAARVRHGDLPRPDDDEAADRYLVADALLAAAGFEWYELSNWSRSPEGRCRHNLLYWRTHNWWGVGPGAHSHLSGTRWWNTDLPDDWAGSLRSGRGPVAGHEHLDEDQRHMERVLTGVRLAEGLPIDPSTHRRLAADPRSADLMDLVEGAVRLTTTGRLLADRAVALVLDDG